MISDEERGRLIDTGSPTRPVNELMVQGQSPIEEQLRERAVARAGQEPEHQPMSDDEFEEAVRSLVLNARALMKEHVKPKVEKAWRYYDGFVDADPMGLIGKDPETGQPVFEGSHQTLSECRDQVQMLIPDIYRVIAGHEESIAIQPNGPEDVAYAEQATDYVRHLFWDKNNGELLVKDALLEWCIKFCAFRIWRENSVKERVSEHEELSEDQVQALMETENLEIEEIEPQQRMIGMPQQAQQRMIGAQQQSMFGVPPPTGNGSMTLYVEQPITLYNVRCRYFERYGRTRVALIPQDELLLDLEAQSMEEATVVGTDCERRAGELLALGLDEDLIKRMAGKGLRSSEMGSDIRRYRSRLGGLSRSHRDTKDDSLHWVRVVDARVLVDRDGDGIAEPWRVIALGDPIEIAWAEEDPGSDMIVVGSPFPRPHTLIGDGIVEVNIDLQDSGTSILRRAMDNYARTIHPRAAITSGGENSWDDLNSWFGDPINLGSTGTISWHDVPFHGDAAMLMLGYLDQRRTLRTGISPAAMGLDPRALKGQTVEAAAGILAGPQSRVEGYAREFATRIMGPLFKGLLTISQKFQDRAEVIRLRNEFVEIDPREWNPEMDVQVDVGLGTGSRVERIAVSNMILQKQELLYMAKSPLFDVKLYHNALSDMTVAMGRKDPERYFVDPESEEGQQAAQRAQQEQQAAQQQAAQMEAQLEGAKSQAKAAAEAQLEQVRAQLDQVKSQIEQAGRERELALEGNMKSGEQQLQAQIDARLLEMEQLWKARLLQLEGVIEEKLLRVKADVMPTPAPGGGSAQGNIRKAT